MLSRSCEFETGRLQVSEWHSASWPERSEDDLALIVAAILTEPVTRSLPETWNGALTKEQAHAWIAERDLEGATLLVAEKDTGKPVGLVILFESSSKEGIEVRLGYLLAEDSWGLGYVTELVAGLVRWYRSRPSIQSLAGGVAHNNPASKRVLEKNGFSPSDVGEIDASEEILRLNLRTR